MFVAQGQNGYNMIINIQKRSGNASASSHICTGYVFIQTAIMVYSHLIDTVFGRLNLDSNPFIET